MGYSQSYGMSGTAVPEWRQGLEKCKQTMSCTKGRCMSYDGAANKCTCVKCDSELVNKPNTGITPRYASADARPGRYAVGIGGLSATICPPGQARRCHMGQCWCSNLVPGTTSVERLTASPMSTMPMNGLGESFLESLGSIANLAIIGLAIYGGFCLAKKL